MKIININVVFLGVALIASSGFAQTTLPGGSDVDGSFAVGNSTNKGGLTIAGQTGNAAAPGINVTGDGGVLFEGNFGTGIIPTEGAGTRLMWYSKKAAFRVGKLDGVYSVLWNESNVGDGSFATSNSSASAEDAVGIGSGFANSEKSVAMATGHTYGSRSVGMTGGQTWAAGSVAMTYGEAYGENSLAFRSYTSGDYAVGLGGNAGGDFSTAMSRGNAYGDYSLAVGYGVTAWSFGSAAFGRFNAEHFAESTTSWVDSDRLFTVGNGTGVHTDPPVVRNRDAFVIYKNGDARFTKRQGDILMGEFGNPE